MSKLPIKIIIMSVLVGFLSACGASYDYRKDSVVTGITVPLGQTVNAGKTGLSVSFDKIESDSRCPINAKCLWAGVAVVKATIKNGEGKSKALSLGTVNFEKINNSERAFERRITLLELLPNPQAGQAGKLELKASSIRVKID